MDDRSNAMMKRREEKVWVTGLKKEILMSGLKGGRGDSVMGFGWMKTKKKRRRKKKKRKRKNHE